MGTAEILQPLEAKSRVLQLDGDGDTLYIPKSDVLEITNQITLECWIQVHEITSEWDRFVVKTWEGDVSPWMYYGLYRVGGTKKLAFDFTDITGQNNMIQTGTEVLVPNTWVHAVGVYNGNQMLLY